jgi:hypothetical protein
MKVINIAAILALIVSIQLSVGSSDCYGLDDRIAGPDAATDIVKAVHSGDLAAVKEMVTKMPELANAKGPYGITPLHAALEKGRKEIAEYLIAQGADVNAKQANMAGLAPLHIAAYKDYRELAKILLAAGAKVNVTNGLRQTPLHGAAHHGCKEMARLLIAKGADVNTKDDMNMTAVDYALAQKHTEIVDLLQSRGAKEAPTSVTVDRAQTTADIIELGKRLFGKNVIAARPRNVSPLTNSLCGQYSFYNVTMKNPLFPWAEEETFPMAVPKAKRKRAFKLSNAKEIAAFLGALETPVGSELEALQRTVVFAELVGRGIQSHMPRRKSLMKEYAQLKSEDWPLVISRTDSGWLIFVTLVIDPAPGVESCWRYQLEISKDDGMSVKSEKHIYQYAALM